MQAAPHANATERVGRAVPPPAAPAPAPPCCARCYMTVWMSSAPVLRQTQRGQETGRRVENAFCAHRWRSPDHAERLPRI